MMNPDLYDRDYFLSHCEGYREFSHGGLSQRLKKVAERLEGKDPLRILDIGCGRGELLQHLVKRGHVCEGVDSSPDGIDIARESAKIYLSESEVDRCRFHLMDARKLAFKNNSFDVVFMVDVVEHLFPSELDAVLNEVQRVLRPRGRLIIHTVPNRWVIKPARLVMKLLGIPSETHRHVNEQSLFSLQKAIRPYFDGRCWIEREKGFWSFWGISSDRAPNKTVSTLLRITDALLDNPVASFIIKLPPLSFFFGTDIWGDLTTRK